MDIPLDEVILIEGISSGSDGAAVDADSAPTYEIFEDTTDTDIGIGGTMTKRTSKTGDYRATVTATAANGFEVGKWYTVVGYATIGGKAAKGILKTFRIVAAEATAGVPKVDLETIKNQALTAAAPITFLASVGTASTSTAQTGDTYARVGAPAGASLSADVAAVKVVDDAIKAKTDNLPSDPADASVIAGRFDTVDTATGAIKAKTDNLPSDPADASVIAGRFDTVDAEVAAVKAKTDNLPTDPADASDIADLLTSLASALTTIATYIDTEVAAIKAKTDNLPSDPADASVINDSFSAVMAALAAIDDFVDSEVSAIKAKTDNLPAAPASADDVLDYEVETGFTLKQLVQLIAAAVAGKCSGGPGSPVFRNIPDTADRIAGTADSSGNRTAATYTPGS